MRKWLIIAVFIILSSTATLAQETNARLRVAHLVWSADAVDIYVDAELVQLQIPSPFLTPYLPLSPGAHTITLVTTGGTPDSALLGPVPIEAMSDHDYLLAVLGHVDDAQWHPLLIDETAAAAGMEPTATQAALLTINGLRGADRINGHIDGETVVASLRFGNFAVTPLELGWRTAQFTIDDAQQSTLFDVGPGTFFGTPYTIVVAAAVGSWPGELFLNNNVQIWPGLSAGNMTDYLRAITAAGNNGIDPFNTMGPFNQLLAALEQADLIDLLAGAGPFTLYAPVDAAFASTTLPANPAQLALLLQGHIVPGTQLPLPDAPVLNLNGNSLSVTFPDNAPPLINNTATFTGQIFAVGNGQIVVIDAVLPGP